MSLCRVHLYRLMLFLYLATVILLLVRAEEHCNLPDCPRSQYLQHYHRRSNCRKEDPDDQLDRREDQYDRLQRLGVGASRVPNERTVVCPAYPVTTVLQPYWPTDQLSPRRKGMDRKWIVENLSSTSVTVSIVLPNGQERSVMKPEDPYHVSMLHPTQFASLDTFEGTVFHVRQVEFNGEPGRLLLQHRVGLVPFYGYQHYDCRINTTKTVQRQVRDPTTGQTQIRTETITTPETNRDLEPIDKVNPERRPAKFQRTETHAVRKCNTIDVGFRNMLPHCPLHVNWVANLAEIPRSGTTCNETFAFHLGLHHQPQDFFQDWKSSTKWEGTLISHTFVARLADQPDVVVDSYTVEPTRIVDCPPREGECQVIPNATLDHHATLTDYRECLGNGTCP